MVASCDFIDKSETVYCEPGDGIHYLPRPTSEVWDYIVDEVNNK